MSRYFFHIYDGDTIMLDREGSELPDLASVQCEAIASAGETLRHCGHNFRSAQPWKMEVADHLGAIVCSLTFTASMR